MRHNGWWSSIERTWSLNPTGTIRLEYTWLQCLCQEGVITRLECCRAKALCFSLDGLKSKKTLRTMEM